MKIGPFFYMKGTLLYDAIPMEQGRRQADKLDNPCGHDQLFDRHFRHGDYIDYPRGRVIWDLSHDRAIIYIDPCIRKPEVLEKIKTAFELGAYVVEEDEHYHCKKCVSRLLMD